MLPLLLADSSPESIAQAVAQAIAQASASQVTTQTNFSMYCLAALATAVAGAITWFAKFMLIPMRDRHFLFLDAQIEHMKGEAECLEAIGENGADLATSLREVRTDILWIRDNMGCARADKPEPPKSSQKPGEKLGKGEVKPGFAPA